jgi:hypothetical protein
VIEAGLIKNFAVAAMKIGVTTARLSQIMNLMVAAPAWQTGS